MEKVSGSAHFEAEPEEIDLVLEGGRWQVHRSSLLRADPKTTGVCVMSYESLCFRFVAVWSLVIVNDSAGHGLLPLSDFYCLPYL